MTGNRKDEREGLRRLVDILAEDILNAPDHEVLDEAAEIYGDPDKLASEMRSLFEQTAREQGKAKLAAGRAAMAADHRRPARVIHLDPAEARRRLQQAIAVDPETARKLTLAARKGQDLSDEDVRTMLEDLEELGVIPPPDIEDADK